MKTYNIIESEATFAFPIHYFHLKINEIRTFISLFYPAQKYTHRAEINKLLFDTPPFWLSRSRAFALHVRVSLTGRGRPRRKPHYRCATSERSGSRPDCRSPAAQLPETAATTAITRLPFPHVYVRARAAGERERERKREGEPLAREIAREGFCGNVWGLSGHFDCE